MSVLIVAEHADGQLSSTTPELITAAAVFGGSVRLLLVSRDPGQYIAQASFAGVDEVVTVSAPTDEFESDVYVDVVSRMIEKIAPKVVLAAYTANAAGYGAAVATRLNLGFASDVYGAQQQNGQIIARRGFYGNKIEAELEFPETECVFLLLRSGSWDPAPEGPGAKVTEYDVEIPQSRARHVKFVEQPQTGPDISQAEFLVSIGRGIGDRENISLFENLATKMNATLSASRPLVDAGWLPKECQVGQSGKIVKPKIYLAFGISGAVQHLAGMKNCGTVIAINTDPDAPIFALSDYGSHIDAVDLAKVLADIWQ